MYLRSKVVNPAQRKDSSNLFPVDGVLIPVKFLKEVKSRVIQIYFIARKKLLASAVPLKQLQSDLSPSELVSFNKHKLFIFRLFRIKRIKNGVVILISILLSRRVQKI